MLVSFRFLTPVSHTGARLHQLALLVVVVIVRYIWLVSQHTRSVEQLHYLSVIAYMVDVIILHRIMLRPVYSSFFLFFVFSYLVICIYRKGWSSRDYPVDALSLVLENECEIFGFFVFFHIPDMGEKASVTTPVSGLSLSIFLLSRHFQNSSQYALVFCIIIRSGFWFPCLFDCLFVLRIVREMGSFGCTRHTSYTHISIPYHAYIPHPYSSAANTAILSSLYSPSALPPFYSSFPYQLATTITYLTTPLFQISVKRAPAPGPRQISYVNCLYLCFC